MAILQFLKIVYASDVTFFNGGTYSLKTVHVQSLFIEIMRQINTIFFFTALIFFDYTFSRTKKCWGFLP